MADELLDRRNFIKSTTAGLGSFFFLCSYDPGKGEKAEEQKASPQKFLFRTLGKTAIKLPLISMGVMNSDNPNLVRAALHSGMVHLDTAQTYQRGTNEAMIGEVLKNRPRDSYVIATKAHLPVDKNTGLYKAEATAAAFQEKIDTSLKNLGLDYVDIYYHHNVWVRESALYEPIMKALGEAKKSGKTRFVGISTHKNEPEVIQAAIDSKFYDVVLTAYNFQQKYYGEMREAIARAAGAGVGVVAMKALGGRRLQEGEAVDPVAALKWVLQDPHVHTIIAGFTTFDQMNLDLSVMESPALTGSEKGKLQWVGSRVGLYCQGCGQCLNQCAQQLPIPDLMRAYMYVYGYRNLREAQDLLLTLDLPLRVCEDCAKCPVNCAMGFNISGKIRDVIRLREVPSEFMA